MIELVIDSCVVIKWFVDEPGTREARDIFEAYLNGNLQLLSPDLIYAEIGNVLWKKFHRMLLAKSSVNRALTEFQQVNLFTTIGADLLDDAVELALNHNQSVYDCLYVALSRRESCPLVTADERLIHKFNGTLPGVTVVSTAKAISLL